MKNLKLKLAGGTAALAAVLGVGAAVAADKLSPTAESDAVVADAAKQLGVSSTKLEDALQKALENRVDAAVADGSMTEAQGTAMKQRIAAGEVPIVGLGPGRGGHGHRGFVDFTAAASYLGVTEDSLRTSLRSGDTLADVAKAKGKTSAGLVTALVTAATADIDEKVAAGKLTAERRTSILADLSDRIEAAVAGELGSGSRGGHGGPPPAGAPDDA